MSTINDHHTTNINSNNDTTNNNVVSKAAGTSSGQGTGQTQQACASCRYQRRKCAANCPLAPYFPAELQKDFLNAHRLFGVRNIMKVLDIVVEPLEREIAMKTMIFQANVRATDPVGGCYRVIKELQRQIDLGKAELDLVLHQLAICRAQPQAAAVAHNNNMANPNPTVVEAVVWNGVGSVDADDSLRGYSTVQSIRKIESPRPLRHNRSFQGQASQYFGHFDCGEFGAIKGDSQKDGQPSSSEMHGKQYFVDDSEDIKPLLRMFDDKQVTPI